MRPHDREDGQVDAAGRIEAILRGDRLFSLYGMEVVEAREGYARLRAVVRDEFLNAHGIAHGALVFALMDVAFAVSVNSIRDAVGIQFNFHIFRAARAGETVEAESRVIHRGRNSLVVEVAAVSAGSGKPLARGTATALPLPRPQAP